MNRRYFLATVASAPLVFSRSAWADDVDAALARVAKARATLKTLRAPFRQKRLIGVLATEVKSAGQLTLVRPDRLRWELEAPDAVTYWIGPEGLAISTGDGVTKVGKAAAGRFGAVLGDLMIMLGGDLKELRSRYRLSVSTTGGGFTLQARPTNREVAKHVSLLSMEAGDELWQVQRVEIEERNGDQSLITFGDNERNASVDPGYMKPPKG